MDSVVIVLDEAQNTTKGQVKMFLPRLAENSKAFVSGDLSQVDVPHPENSGFSHALKILRNIGKIVIISFGRDDVVRISPLSKRLYKRMSTRKIKFPLSGVIGGWFKKIRNNTETLVLLAVGFFVLFLGTCVSFVEDSGTGQIDLDDFKVGTVADRDVTLNRDLSYVDKDATEIRRNAKLSLVTAVFRYISSDYDFTSEATTLSASQAKFFEFLHYLEELRVDSSDAVTNSLEVQELYPGTVSSGILESFFSLDAAVQTELLQFTSAFFNVVVSKGLAAFPVQGMEQFSRTEVEVVRGSERASIPKSSVLTKENLPDFLDSEAVSAGFDRDLEEYVLAFVSPFLKENLVYQREDSELKLKRAMESVSPVTIIIPQGEKIIRRGFLVTEENYKLLEYLCTVDVKINTERFFATLLVLFLSMILSVFMLSVVACKELSFFRYRVFLVVCFVFMYAACLVFSHIHPLQKPLNFMLVVPLGFFTMLIAILLRKSVAIVMVFSLASAVFCASGFMSEPTVFAIFSGIVAVAVVRDTGRRMDLVYSAGVLSLLYAAISFIVAIVYPVSLPGMSFYVFSAAVNGFLSGMLVISFLPLMENVLNSITRFRLMELSDVNTPLMQKMLITVPGTYNHSQMVASLAESACRKIGANFLLARVGAYYHDIGKMDQGEYFSENQNTKEETEKHASLPPRLSATIIRSHVQQGIEKARNLRLPQEVIDIIAEHHGNDVISWFYNKAKEENPDTDPADFTYPGHPPRSKESAVVMLADTVEAACKSLPNHSATSLEKKINELVEEKRNRGQLQDCELTFHDVSVIKQVFLTILVGYYHNRVKYPNQKDFDTPDVPSEGDAGKEKPAGAVRKDTAAPSGGKAGGRRRLRRAAEEAAVESSDGKVI